MKNNINAIVLFLLKLILGITFIYAAYHKIADPVKFAKILYGYAIFPGASINILAISIPFIEFIAGICLIFNILFRSALLLVNILLLSFILMIGFNFLRGHQFDCGCFSFSNHSQVLSNIYLLIRDFILLLSGIYLWMKTKTGVSQ